MVGIQVDKFKDTEAQSIGSGDYVNIGDKEGEKM